MDRVLSGVSLLPPRLCPPEVAAIMSGCWRRRPADRLRMRQVHRALDAMLRCHVTGNGCDDHEYLQVLDA